jgi:DinB superfamily
MTLQTFETYQTSLNRIRAAIATRNERCAGRPLELLERRPTPGVWSIKQNTLHLGDAFKATTIRAQGRARRGRAPAAALRR